MNKKIVAALAVAALLTAGACKRGEQAAAGKPKAPAAPAGTEVGFSLPAYSATMLDGSKLDFDQKRGKVVLVNVWATWCGPCRYEIPELQRLHDANAAKGFEVVGVSVDESPVDDVKAFVADKKMTYPVAVDPEGKLASLLQTSVLPTSVLLDRNGKIVWKKFGAIFENDPELAKAIAAAL